MNGVAWHRPWNVDNCQWTWLPSLPHGSKALKYDQTRQVDYRKRRGMLCTIVGGVVHSTVERGCVERGKPDGSWSGADGGGVLEGPTVLAASSS